MTIKLRRDTGWIGSIRSAKVKINDQIVGKVPNHHEIVLSIDEPTAAIQVVQSSTKSKLIEVSKGDYIHVTSNIWVSLLTLLIFCLPLINSLFIESKVFSWVSIALLLSQVVAFFIPGYYFQVKKVSQEG